MIKSSCKKCGQKLNVEDKHSGKRVKCPKCGDECVIPDNPGRIKFHCKNCGQSISVPQIHVGKKGKCPKCKNPIVVPSLKREPSDGAGTVSVVCSMCNEAIQVPEISRGQTVECPECGSSIETSSESTPAASAESDASIPPTTDQDLYEEDPEAYEESVGVDKRIIVGISAVAAVVVVGLIILAAVLRSSGLRPAERPDDLRGQQQVADTDSRPQPVTSDNALSDSFTWTYINVDIEIQENGDLLISEQQEYSFKAGPNEKRHELSRLFWMDRIDDIQDVEVYERTGSDETSSEPLNLTHRIVRDQNDLWICWSYELNPPETRTFLLKYRVIGHLSFSKSTSLWRRKRRSRGQSMDELCWTAVIWPRPAVVEKVKVTVHLPSKLRGKNRTIGSYGRIASFIKPDLDTIEFNSFRAIPRETGLQIHLAFQHGILKIKTTKGQRWRVLWVWWPLTLCLTIFPIMLIWSIVTGDWSIWEEKGLSGSIEGYFWPK
jgi:DNA-directed RNA polymerase subunit RPC12/RpoP